jgi:hypothetical protein
MSVAEIIEQARVLSVAERKELVKLLIDTLDVSPSETPTERVSILELAGLGAEIWKDVDAQEYINQLRDEWDRDENI